MNNELKDRYLVLEQTVASAPLKKAIEQVRAYLGQSSFANGAAQLRAVEQRYYYMLSFLAEGNSVPEIDKELAAMRAELKHIAAEAFTAKLAEGDSSLFASQLRFQNLRPEENTESLVSDYLAEINRIKADFSVVLNPSLTAKAEKLSADIFMHLWVAMPFTAELAEMLEGIFDDEEIPQYDKLLWLSAIGLGNLEFADDRRVALMQKLVESPSPQTSSLAALWLLLDVRADAAEAIEASAPGLLTEVYTELVRALGTAALTAELRRDILPGMMNISREMTQKFADDPAKLEESMRNGEWDMGVDASGYDKIKSFVEAQNQGGDVYMSTLGSMRQFPFFNNIPAWFLPFHTGHSELAAVTGGEGAAFADTIAQMPHICDSDKYALILSIAAAPEAMRQKLLASMAEQYSTISEQLSDQAKEYLDGEKTQILVNRYVKNLYRFFTLFRRKNEFPAVFDADAIVSAIETNARYLSTDSIRTMAEMLLKQHRYGLAAKLFNIIVADPTTKDPARLYQQLGYAQELSGERPAALDSYLEALHHKPADKWTTARAAALLLRAGKPAEANDLLMAIGSDLSTDPQLLTLYAESLEMAGRNAEALDALYNLEYIDEEAPEGKYLPAMAWLSVQTGAYTEAAEMFAKLEGVQSNFDTLLHHAHLLWARGETKAALEKYAQASSLAKVSGTDFYTAFAGSLTPAFASRLEPQALAALRTVPDLLEYKS